MKIGFDLDGVIVSCNSFIWGLTDNDIAVQKLALEEVKPMINPRLFASETDELVIITARSKAFEDLTKRWCKHFFPGIPLYMVDGIPMWSDIGGWDVWYKKVAERKAAVINHLKLDVYFEDMPVTVKHLRDMCPNTKIIQYGGRIGWPE